MPYKTEGLIYDIQRYSLHDGPGIRTIVFLKGCPLRCPWCANPESQSCNKEVMGDQEVGQIYTVEEAMEVVKRDMPFYRRSGGGMTLSGGEPLMQSKFSKDLVQAAKDAGINVAIETSGYQKWDLAWKVLEDIDHILFDMKAFDKDLHKKIVGVDNGLILDNLEKLSKENKDITVRVPVIPEHNDGFDNLSQTVEHCKSLGIKEVHLLPYHQLGVHKYEKLDREYEVKTKNSIDKSELENLASDLGSRYGVQVKVC